MTDPHTKERIIEEDTNPDGKVILTVGCDSNLQKRNKLKGIAMQKILLPTMAKKMEDTSLKKMLEVAEKKVHEYYWVQTPFKTDERYYKIKYEFVHHSEFPEIMDVWIIHKITKKDKKKCSHCGIEIQSQNQFSKKCYSCGIGFFNIITNKLDRWEQLIKSDKQTALQKLCEEGYLKKITSLKKRTDFFEYENNFGKMSPSSNQQIREGRIAKFL